MVPPPPPPPPQEAALYVHEGEDNDAFTYHPAGKWSKLAYTILHNPVFYITDLVTSILLMLLAFIEVPTVIEDLDHEEIEKLVAVSAIITKAAAVKRNSQGLVKSGKVTPDNAKVFCLPKTTISEYHNCSNTYHYEFLLTVTPYIDLCTSQLLHVVL